MFLSNKIRNDLIGSELMVSYSLRKNGIEIASNQINNSNSVGNVIEQVIGDLYSDMLIEGPPNQSPDYYIKNPLTFIENQTVNEVEVKVFENNPNFDIGNFDAYTRVVFDTESGLNIKIFKTMYLIIEYESITSHSFHIKDVWVKNVWELPNYDGKYPLSLQVKQNRPYNIRPGTKKSWDDEKKTPQMFIDSLIECRRMW